LDPFLSYNASFSGQDIKDVSAGITHILLTHCHGDHVGDTVALAKETCAVVLANADIAAWLGSKGSDKIEMGNTGGT
ncbi:MBL fold metallo-hydrolase, partial [Rhizobium ruizarguesonis]